MRALHTEKLCQTQQMPAIVMHVDAAVMSGVGCFGRVKGVKLSTTAACCRSPLHRIRIAVQLQCGALVLVYTAVWMT